jgi:phospholipase C
MNMRALKTVSLLAVAVAMATAASTATAGAAERGSLPPGTGAVTPIQHVVVTFQENVSFDHYFATYPNAANPANEPRFQAARDTPTLNGLNEPFADPTNVNSAQPFRLDRS